MKTCGLFPANNNATTRQVGGGVTSLPSRGSRRGRKLLLRGLPVPHPQGDQSVTIAFVWTLLDRGHTSTWTLILYRTSTSVSAMFSALLAALV